MKKGLIALFCALFVIGFTAPADASAPKVATKYYKNKKNVKYAQVTSGLTATARKNINNTLLAQAKKDYGYHVNIENSQREDMFEDWCLDMPSTCNYTFDSSFKVKSGNAKYWTLQHFNYSYTGGAHGMGGTTLYNFDRKTGKRVTIADALKSSLNIKKVHTYAYNYMKDRERFFVDKPSDFKLTRDTQFYFTPSGITLVFQSYEVASYADGYPEVKIPASVYR
ncbi:DUF3298 and DUF4163 domain-containing protein [Exiguobacterium flavidum]|uniref:DUF3298 and DUF4163 domain-containing protein n=1 Tax=Exiguobacterium flavidum TaxID=2184695 RepID=UPI000DF7EA4D|nr:DUF3298 and DUF4163 domain-containing protein [Exiguobacterium flavidum]